MKNKIYIRSYISSLAKVAYFLNIDSKIKLEERIDTSQNLWRIIDTDERGTGVLIAADNRDIDPISIGRIAKKCINNRSFYDVWYLRNRDGFRCNNLLQYRIDISKPIIREENQHKIPINNPTKHFRIECLECIKENHIHDCSLCENIIKEGCIND